MSAAEHTDYPIAFEPFQKGYRIMSAVMESGLGWQNTDIRAFGRAGLLLAVAPAGSKPRFSLEYIDMLSNGRYLESRPEQASSVASWRRDSMAILREVAASEVAKRTTSWAVANYYEPIARLARTVNGQPHLAVSASAPGEERPLDYVGVGQATHRYWRRTSVPEMRNDRAINPVYLPLFPDAEDRPTEGVADRIAWALPDPNVAQLQGTMSDVLDQSTLAAPIRQALTAVDNPTYAVRPLALFEASQLGNPTLFGEQ